MATDESEDTSPLGGFEREIKEVLGLFDVPAFARRGKDVEQTRVRLRWRSHTARSALLDMVRLRLKQWSRAATGPGMATLIFTDRIDALWPLSHAPEPAWASYADSNRRLRAIGRDLIASAERFNRRWADHLDRLDLTAINRQIDHYNRYYVLEKECVVGSARLASRHFVPYPPVTLDELLAAHPFLPVPQLR